MAYKWSKLAKAFVKEGAVAVETEKNDVVADKVEKSADKIVVKGTVKGAGKTPGSKGSTSNKNK